MPDRPRVAVATPGRARPASTTAIRTGTEPAVQPLPAGVVRLHYRQATLNSTPHGFGASTSSTGAAVSARGEAWERHALLDPGLARPEPRPRRIGSCADARGLAFDYLRAAAPLEHDHHTAVADRVCRRFDSTRPVAMFPGRWIYLDASAASNSNGVAAGPTRARAIEAARLELIERDTLLRAWYGLVASRPFDADERADRSVRRLERAAAAVDLHARWFVLGAGRECTVTCILAGARAPHLGLGSATRASLPDAARKAFIEAAGSHLAHVLVHRQLGARAFARLAGRVMTCRPGESHRRYFETFWAAHPREAAREIAARFSQRRVRTRHLLSDSRFAWIDLTPRNARRTPVVKVLHPAAAPLPNTRAQVALLEHLLGVRGDGTPLPIS